MPDPNPNAVLAEQAAAAVDPKSPEQQAIIARASAPTPSQSYADRIMGKSSDPTQADNSFFAGLDKVRAVKDGPPADPDAETEHEDNASATPPDTTPAKLTDPPVAKRQKSNFRAIEAQLKEARAKVQELEGKAAQGNGHTPQAAQQAAPQSGAELLALQKELEEARTELALLDITKSPEFKQKFEAPRSITVKQAKNIAGAKGSEVETILQMPPGALRDQKLEELLGELPPSTAAIVRAANNKLAELSFYEQVELEQNRTTAQARYQQREANAQRQAALNSATFDQLVRDWSTSVPSLKGDGAPALIAEARKYFDGAVPPQDRAAAAMRAALVPALLAESEQQEQRIEKLERQLARYTDGLPGGGNTVQETDEPARPQSIGDRDKAFMSGLNKAISSGHGDFRRHQGF